MSFLFPLLSHSDFILNLRWPFCAIHSTCKNIFLEYDSMSLGYFYSNVPLYATHFVLDPTNNMNLSMYLARKSSKIVFETISLHGPLMLHL